MTMAAPKISHDVLLNKGSQNIEEETACFECRDFGLYYGATQALKDINLIIPEKRVTAFIGPSGCGKSTLLRCMNRMNDLIDIVRLEGEMFLHGEDINTKSVNVAELRRKVGMVFQKPNPFPKSIYENVAWGARINGYKGNMDHLVESCLQKAALWDEVKDNLKKSGLALSGGQQQRLCIARTIATEPDIILMDEPCSALDPIATLKVEELMRDLQENYTIVIVTHNMQQAGRVSNYTAMMMLTQDRKAGTLIEFDETNQIFTSPSDQRTEDYITGRFG